MKNKERIAILETEISRLKVANRNNIYRIEAIESHLAEQHKGANFSKLNSSGIPNTCEPITPDFIPDWKDAPEDAVCVAMDGNGDWFWWRHKPTSDLSEKGRWNTMSVLNGCEEYGLTETDWFADSATNAHLLPPDYWKSTLMMRPDAVIELNKALHNVLVNHAPNVCKSSPDYTHLLPDGYEFCQEADAEKWVKVEKLDVNDNDEYPIGHIDNFTCFKGRWRPIRPIQYKVTTHEIVTAVPDPYQPDWSQAPEGTVAHVFNSRGLNGMWIVKSHSVFVFKSAYHQIPPDLDWKQSLRVKPN
jgi:hypothetical protein